MGSRERDEEAMKETVKTLSVESEPGSPQCVSPRGSIHIRIWQGSASYGGPGPHGRLKSLHWDQQQLGSQ